LSKRVSSLCVKETACKGFDWVDLAQDTVHWWALVSTEKELWILLKIGNSDDRLKVKVNGEVHPRTDLEGPEMKYTYTSTLSLTSAIDGSGQSTPQPLYPRGETLCKLCERLNAPGVRSGRVRKISPPRGFDPWTIQPVTNCYTDYALLATDDRLSASKGDSYRKKLF